MAKRKANNRPEKSFIRVVKAEQTADGDTVLNIVIFQRSDQWAPSKSGRSQVNSTTKGMHWFSIDGQRYGINCALAQVEGSSEDKQGEFIVG